MDSLGTRSRAIASANTDPGTIGNQKANTLCATTPTSAMSSGTPTTCRSKVVAASTRAVAINGMGSDCTRYPAVYAATNAANAGSPPNACNAAHRLQMSPTQWQAAHDSTCHAP